MFPTGGRFLGHITGESEFGFGPFVGMSPPSAINGWKLLHIDTEVRRIYHPGDAHLDECERRYCTYDRVTAVIYVDGDGKEIAFKEPGP
jgi:hypothetical protein